MKTFLVILFLGLNLSCFCQLTENDTVYHYSPDFCKSQYVKNDTLFISFCFDKENNELFECLPVESIGYCLTYIVPRFKTQGYFVSYQDFLKCGNCKKAILTGRIEIYSPDIWKFVLNGKETLMTRTEIIDSDFDVGYIEDYLTGELYMDIRKYYKLKKVK